MNPVESHPWARRVCDIAVGTCRARGHPQSACVLIYQAAPGDIRMLVGGQDICTEDLVRTLRDLADRIEQEDGRQ